MNILVTGGAGFIGSHLVEALVKKGHRVRVLDDLSSGKRENLDAVKNDVELTIGDCADPDMARRATTGIEVVYHEGAVPSVARSVKDPLGSHRANATATVTMLVAARDAGVRRFVYAGSSSVYGNATSLPKTESMEPQPLSPYAVGKLAGEHYVHIFATLYGMQTLTLRYFNVFGPRQDPSSPYSGVISQFATALLGRRSSVIYGDGLQTRDFTYVDNVVHGNLRALRVRGLKGQVANIATGCRVTLKHLFAAMAREIGVPGRIEYGPARPGDVRHSLADISRAKKLLGYQPLVGLKDGLRSTIAWYREEQARPARSTVSFPRPAASSRLREATRS